MYKQTFSTLVISSGSTSINYHWNCAVLFERKATAYGLLGTPGEGLFPGSTSRI